MLAEKFFFFRDMLYLSLIELQVENENDDIDNNFSPYLLLRQLIMNNMCKNVTRIECECSRLLLIDLQVAI